ncbi:hypothetical protein D3C84_1045230 [compost metagenome]
MKLPTGFSRPANTARLNSGLQTRIGDFGQNADPVGASLLAMRPAQSTLMSPDTSLSRASSLPQGFAFADRTHPYRSGLFGAAILAAWSCLLLLQCVVFASGARKSACPLALGS